MFSYLASSPLFSSPKNTAIFMVVVFSVLHLFTMGQAALTNDEAQYALYGYYLDWSYFDHPPLVGWLNATILLFSDSDFALRVWPLLLAILTSFLLYGFSRELFPTESDWVATVTVLLYQSSLISQAFALAMLPDTPLVPISIAAAWLLHRSLTNKQPHLLIYVGILFGLAGLAKYTAITLVITALFALLIYKSHKLIFTKWPWISIALAAIIVSPVFYWNIQNDWISISYQINHGVPERPWLIKNFFVSQASQFITYTPAIFIFGLLAIFKSIKNTTKNVKNKNELYILAVSLPVLILFASLSGYAKTLPHWVALGWIALCPLIAKWIVQHWNNKSVRVLSYFNLSYSFVLIISMHLLLATSIMPFTDNNHPLEDLYGWKEVAAKAVELQKKMQSEQSEKKLTPVIFTGNWAQFARLAWYAKPAAVQITEQRFQQSDIWYGSAQLGSDGILVVPPKYKDSDASGLKRFEHCDFQQDVLKMIKNKIAATYQLYRCYGYKG